MSLLAIVLLMLVTSISTYPLAPPTPGVGAGGGAAGLDGAAAAGFGASGGGTERHVVYKSQSTVILAI